MSEDYKPKRAITIIRPNEVGQNQVGLLVRVTRIPESRLILNCNDRIYMSYKSEDGARWYQISPNDVIEVLP